MSLPPLFSMASLALFVCLSGLADAQVAPYDNPPPVEPPFFRVRYEASQEPGGLIFPVQYTVWIPEGVKTLRGVVVHQHGCGEGSCKSGQTGAFDLHWQALAKKHGCALMAPSYEQPQKADCGMWCDPRNGSGDAFQRALVDLGEESGHPELAKIPWALWGHSGGGVWTGGMTLLYPERVAATWLRSGVPLLEPNPDRPGRKTHAISEGALRVPVMCNPGTKEGVTVKEGRFSRVWPLNETFFKKLRAEGGLVGVAVDPLTGHECGNQRYMAIPWFDACLAARLPDNFGEVLKPMPAEGAWLAPLLGEKAVPTAEFEGDVGEAVWLPNEAVARSWMRYVKDTEIPDQTPPPAPFEVTVEGNVLTWKAEADLESGIAFFAIERDGERIATVPEEPTNRFGRPLFQGLQYSDTPEVPLVPMKYVDMGADPEKDHEYRIVSFNTAGLRSID